MEWPSDRVAQGGIFQPAKANYSQETTQFIKILLNESKLTTMQRDKVKYCLRNGQPLPSLSSSGGGHKHRSKKHQVLIRPGSSKRRSLNTIAQSGAYERERFIPKKPNDREAMKATLQDKMAYGKEMKPEINKTITKKKVEDTVLLSRFDQLKLEIQERQDWLKEMEELGEGDKHRQYINQQIFAKIREMNKLEVCDDSPRKK